jgi:stringent starvation protein B
MPIPIADLEVTEAGVSATLSFARIPHRTYVPWSAVYAVTCTTGCGVLYGEDIPPEIALATPADGAMVELGVNRRSQQPRYRMREDEGAEEPWLRAVPSVADEMPMHLHSRRRRPQLRVVK